MRRDEKKLDVENVLGQIPRLEAAAILQKTRKNLQEILSCSASRWSPASSPKTSRIK